MRIASIALFVIFSVAVVLGLYWYYLHVPANEPDPAESSVETTEPSDERAYPVPEPDQGHVATASDTSDGDADTREADAGEATGGDESEPEPEPLPALAESDGHLLNVLSGLLGPAVVEEWFKDERIVERLVVTVNSLDGESIALRFWPVSNLEGLPAITRVGETLQWSAVNALRYRPAVDLLTGLEPEAVARAYFRNYPLFQQAYDSLGVEPAYFNDRLVQIVDHLLGAQILEPGFRLKQPKVLYEYADPTLESESWGRKLLMRMGPENAERVKHWLRRLREELVAGAARD